VVHPAAEGPAWEVPDLGPLVRVAPGKDEFVPVVVARGRLLRLHLVPDPTEALVDRHHPEWNCQADLDLEVPGNLIGRSRFERHSDKSRWRLAAMLPVSPIELQVVLSLNNAPLGKHLPNGISASRASKFRIIGTPYRIVQLRSAGTPPLVSLVFLFFLNGHLGEQLLDFVTISSVFAVLRMIHDQDVELFTSFRQYVSGLLVVALFYVEEAESM